MSFTTLMQNLAKSVVDGFSIRKSRKPITAYSANGAIDPTIDIAKLAKTSAAAMTLAAPATANDGHELQILSTTAYAHTITSTDLIDDGVTGGSKDLITLAAYAGAGCTLVACGGKWIVKSSTAATITGS